MVLFARHAGVSAHNVMINRRLRASPPRRLVDLLVVGLLVAAAVLLAAPPADALGPDCKEAPPATAPGNPIGGNPAQQPTGQDPFAAKSSTTVYREYG